MRLIIRLGKDTSELSNKKEPKPIKNNNIPVWEQVIHDMQERNQIGIKRYKTPLQTFNGRNALIDAYQEALDLSVYLKQRILEEKQSEPLPIEKYLIDFCNYLEERKDLAPQVTIVISDEKADEIISLIKT